MWGDDGDHQNQLQQFEESGHGPFLLLSYKGHEVHQGTCDGVNKLFSLMSLVQTVKETL